MFPLASAGLDFEFGCVRIEFRRKAFFSDETKMEMDGIGVYGEAKTEYTRQVCNFLVPALEGYFLDVLSLTKEREKDPKRILFQFQKLLEEIPDWNVDKVQRETGLILEKIKCDYMEELLTAVFIAHTKVLSAIRLTSKHKKLQITIPKLDHFLFRCLQECGRKLWSNAYLLSDQVTNIERQKNLRQVEQLIQEGVLQSIHGMLPVKNILKEYLAEDAEGDEEEKPPAAAAAVEPEEEEKPVPAEEAAKPVEEEAKPVVVEEAAATVAVEEEAKPAAAPAPAEPVEEVKLSLPELVEEPKPTAEAAPATIVVATEPSVSFTKMDTIFDQSHPERNEIAMVDMRNDEDAPEFLTILEEPAGEMDDFEDLDHPEKGDFILGDDEYEKLG